MYGSYSYGSGPYGGSSNLGQIIVAVVAAVFRRIYNSRANIFKKKL